MCRAVAWLLALAVAGTSAKAEVRLETERQHSSVRVTADASGAWSLRGRIDNRVLNPLGTLTGDGLPTVSVLNGTALAAWTRSTTDELHLALGHDGWAWVGAIPGVKPIVTPQLAAWSDGWIVAWNESSTAHTKLCFVTESGVIGSPWTVGEGELQALAVTGARLQVVTLTDNDKLQVWAISVPDQDPVIFRSHSTTILDTSPVSPAATGRWRLSTGRVLHLPADATVVFGTGEQSTLLDPTWQSRSFALPSTLAMGSSPLGGSLVGLVRVHVDEYVALWWTDAHTVEYANLTSDGMTSVERVTSRSEFDPSLVREALRASASSR